MSHTHIVNKQRIGYIYVTFMVLWTSPKRISGIIAGAEKKPWLGTWYCNSCWTLFEHTFKPCFQRAHTLEPPQLASWSKIREWIHQTPIYSYFFLVSSPFLVLRWYDFSSPSWAGGSKAGWWAASGTAANSEPRSAAWSWLMMKQMMFCKPKTLYKVLAYFVKLWF